MSGKKHFREVENWLDRCGYRLSHANAKAQWVYVHDSAPDLVLNPAMPEFTANQAIRALRKMAGQEQKATKRKPQNIRDRQQRDRDQLAQQINRLKAERAEIVRLRDASLNGLGKVISRAEMTAIADRVEQIDREQRALQALMAAPVTGPNSGTRHAQHRTGAS